MNGSRVCPKCGSSYIRRSHKRGLLEKILATTGVRPYRCDACDKRFFGRTKEHAEASAAGPAR